MHTSQVRNQENSGHLWPHVWLIPSNAICTNYKKPLPHTRLTSHDLQKTQKAQRARKIRNSTSVSFNYTVLAHQFGGKKLPTSEGGCQAKQPGASGCRPHSGHLHPRALGDQTAHWSLHSLPLLARQQRQQLIQQLLLAASVGNPMETKMGTVKATINIATTQYAMAMSPNVYMR